MCEALGVSWSRVACLARYTPFLLLYCGLLNGCRSDRPFYAFIDRSGLVKIRLNPSQTARSFSEGLAAVSVNGKWGFIDSGGQFAIPPQFGWVGDFSEGRALVTSAPADQYWNKNTLFGYINTSGQFVIPPRFNWALAFSDGLAPFCIGPCRNEGLSHARIGYIDHLGAIVLAPSYPEANQFSEGLACATRDVGLKALKGFINKSGQFVVEPRFMWAGEFRNGLAATDLGFVNHHGDVVISSQAAGDAREFREGLAAVEDGERTAFIDIQGRVILRPICEAVGQFSEDLAPACPRNCGPSELGFGQNWGYIDKSGKFALKPQFGYKPEPFRNGLALVCFGCKG